jgi:hypothetical protein
MEWDELLSMVEHRLGLYVGRPRYDRAFSVITGFDLARAQDELKKFQRCMVERHPGTNLVFWTLILVETFGEHADESRLVTDEDHRLATDTLCLRLREFLGLRHATAQ